MIPAQHQCKVKDWLLSNIMHIGYNICVNVVMCLPHKTILCWTMQAGELVQQLAGMQLQDPASSAGGPDNQQPACQLFRHMT